MLVLQQRGQRGVGVQQRIAQAKAAQPDAQRQGVDKQSQRAARLFASLHAAQQHCAEHHILTARGTGQHQGPCQMENRCRAHTVQPGLAADGLCQIGIQGQTRLPHIAAIALYIQQPIGHGGLLHIGQHAAKELLMGGG